MTTAILLIGLALYYAVRTVPPRLTLVPAGFDDLDGWSADPVAAALPAFLRSCVAMMARPDTARLVPRGLSADFGAIGDWRPLCHAAADLATGDDHAVRRFFETGFAPVLAGNNGAVAGLFTGYYEIELAGSRRREGPYQTPIYRRPPTPVHFTRAEIEDGALAGQGLALAWAADPIAVFFLQIQGSGVVRLPDGSTMRVGYDGANGHGFVPVGRLLLQRGLIPRDKMSMAAIRDWMAANPAAGAALRREDPSYVFFREIIGAGPIGAEQVVLAPGRSLAVDRRFLPLGLPIWLDASERFSDDTIRRLVIAQDTGGAIRGPVRGDMFWGTGAAAGARAGRMNARGRYYLLLPRSVAAAILEH